MDVEGRVEQLLVFYRESSFIKSLYNIFLLFCAGLNKLWFLTDLNYTKFVCPNNQIKVLILVTMITL